MVSTRIFLVFLAIFTIGEYNVSSQIVLESRELRKDPRPNIQNHRQVPDGGDQKTADVHYIRPDSVTNSHRPQYYGNQKNDPNAVINKNRQTLDRIVTVRDDSVSLKDTNSSKKEKVETFNFEIDEDDEDYKPSNHMRNKHNQIKSILVKLLDRNEQRMKFASVLPILKVLTPPQRLVLASLISKQLSADSRNPALSVEQVEAMFGNNPNVTSDLMLPILLDIANMVRDAKDHMRTVPTSKSPHAQLLRRSFSLDDEVDPMESHSLDASGEIGQRRPQGKSLEGSASPRRSSTKIAAKIPSVPPNDESKDTVNIEDETVSDDAKEVQGNVTIPPEVIAIVYAENNGTDEQAINGTLNLNKTLSGDVPVAEKLRALNRFIDRHGNIVVLARPPWSPDGSKYVIHRKPPNLEQLIAAHRRRTSLPNRKNLADVMKQKCDLFTNSLCLDSLDYPAEAIMGSIRRNQAAMSALLADFPEVSADSAIDGVTSKQENKYTPEYYMTTANRREDGLDAGGASGFMCPSTVKYARPQKARATSGEWKYIVNTGEHTQTLRLEKCLRPKESCTYLTDNFKSKCVQVYNYHRLLTWDQTNGLHMDIFKVPTCCSCHIEGYSVAFPPHTSKPHQSPAEHFPGEDIHDVVIPYEDVQPSNRRPSQTVPFPGHIPPDSGSHIGDSNNFIPGSTFSKTSYLDDLPPSHVVKHIPISNQFDADQYQHPSTNIRNVKKPARTSAPGNEGLPSYLEPPSKSAIPVNSFGSNTPPKPKPNSNGSFKRGNLNVHGQTVSKRPIRRPIRKKTSVAEDQLVGATHENPTIINMNSFEDINESVEDFQRTSPRSTTTSPRPFVSSTSKVTIKNVALSTTEKYLPAEKDEEDTVPKESSPNRRVNYNYHPIIDFFEGGVKKDSIADRMDVGYNSGEETDWRPMVRPAAFPLKSPPTERSSKNRDSNMRH